MQVYIVYIRDTYVINHPEESYDVVGVCTTKEKAFDMIQEFGKRIEDRCRKNGNAYTKTTQNNNWRLYYDVENDIKEKVMVYCTVEELDKIILEDES